MKRPAIFLLAGFLALPTALECFYRTKNKEGINRVRELKKDLTAGEPGVDESEDFEPKVLIHAEAGSGEGQMGVVVLRNTGPFGPWAIAIGKTGDIYILDGWNERVVRYSKAGTYLESIYPEKRKIMRKTPQIIFENIKRLSPSSPMPKEFVEVPAYSLQDCCVGLDMFVDDSGHIYYRHSLASDPESYAVVVFNRDGKIRRFFTKKELDPEGDGLHNMVVDGEGSISLRKGATRAIEISPGGEINEMDHEKTKMKEKMERNSDSGKMRMRKDSFKNLSPALVDRIKDVREGGTSQLTEDEHGCIYELIWDARHPEQGVDVIKMEPARDDGPHDRNLDRKGKE
ncbi:MAG: hypothetical protein HY548_07675 [Elusimicrobia bacterium]|nr:hypothetical protein [Elusimicrobiota bacterium]